MEAEKEVGGDKPDKMEVGKNEKKTKEFSRTQKIVVCLSGVVVFVIFLVMIPVLYFFLDRSTYMSLAKWLMFGGIMLLILGCVIVGISVGIRWLKRK